jgi:hypothetical protein
MAEDEGTPQPIGHVDYPKRSRPLVDWFAVNPRIGLIGTIASVISIPLAVLLFLASQKDRNIRYAVSASPTTIVKAGQSSDLRVQFKGKELTSDVSIMQIAVWNAGKESVKRENILSETLSLKLEPRTTILESRIKKTTRNLVGFRMDTSKGSAGILTLSWNILEGGDGALLEVIYTGSSEQVVIEGAIEGKVPIRRVTFGDRPGFISAATFAKLIAFSLVIGFGAAGKLYPRIAKPNSSVPKELFFLRLVTEVLVWMSRTFVASFAVLMLYLLIKRPEIPFAF